MEGRRHYDQPHVWMPKQGLVLTGGVYNGCADDVLDESKLMVVAVVPAELDTVDSLFFLPESV
jgi:hypothetical protein